MKQKFTARTMGTKSEARHFFILPRLAILTLFMLSASLIARSRVIPCIPPVAYSVSGGGSYCAGGSGVFVGLTNSDAGITYQLQLGGTNIGTPVSGTGVALNFGLQTAAGTYGVIATNTSSGCTATMTGSTTVSINPLPAAFAVVGGGSFCSGGTGVNVGLSGSGTGISYQLQRGGVNVALTNLYAFRGTTAGIVVYKGNVSKGNGGVNQSRTSRCRRYRGCQGDFSAASPAGPYTHCEHCGV